MRTLAPTLLFVLVPLLAAVLALGAYLKYASVRNTYLEMVSARHETVARRIAEDAEMALSVGLPLAGQEALTRSLERESSADPAIGSVDVLSAAGRVLFSSDPARIGVDEALADAADLQQSAAIVSPFGTAEGRVVVRADGAALRSRLDTLWFILARTALIAFIVGAIAIAAVILIAVSLLNRRLLRRGETGAGETVPAEALPAIAEVDEAHRALAARLAARER